MSLADALEEAQQKVAQLLPQPEDLQTKLPHLIAKYQQEKQSLDAVLKRVVGDKLDGYEESLSALQRSEQSIKSMQEWVKQVEDVCKNSQIQIQNYDKIKRISKTHQNFVKTKEIIVRFQALSQDVERLSQMIRVESENILGPADSLLQIHYELYKLEEFRDITVHQAKTQGPTVINIINKYFKRLDSLSEQFREYLWTLGQNILELVKEDQGQVLVKICKIVEAEEMADEQVMEYQHRMQQSSGSIGQSQQQSNNITSLQVVSEAILSRSIKNYRSQLLNSILESIQIHYRRMIPSEDSVADALENSHFIFNDLALVFDEVAVRFPPKYKIFPFYVLQYHKLTYDLLNRLTQRGDMETKDILLVLGWVRDYYKVMNDRLGVTEELLEPKLLDDNEAKLSRDYVKLISTKLLEWVDRLLLSEKKDFIERDKAPDTDSDEMYATSAPVILFQIVNQQIDIVFDAAKGGRLLSDVGFECLRTLKHFQSEQMLMLEQEEQRFLMKKDQFAPGFAEYVIALSNNNLKCSEYLEAVYKRLEEKLDDSAKSEFSKLMNEVMEGFMRITKKGCSVLQTIMFNDINGAMSQVFTASWYENSTMPSVLATLNDYLQDYKAHLQDYLFSKLSSESLEHFVVLILQALKSKNCKLKMPQAVNQLRSEYITGVAFWSDIKSPKRVRQTFDVLDKIIAVLESSSTVLFISWYALWKAYNDVPLQFIEDLLYKRDDLDRSELKEAVQAIRAKLKEQKDGNAEATTSVFSKM
ncbi:hypothetical protein MIR68_007465 [Amoeboaphelidium protococcarum]|nr:hypothetical protein MIR68_007465 [Amoeboaphelidium protococcarum]